MASFNKTRTRSGETEGGYLNHYQPYYDYHYVYQEKGYIYDPRASSLPMPKGDYFKLIKQYNPSGFTLEEEPNNMMGVNLRKIKP